MMGRLPQSPENYENDTLSMAMDLAREKIRDRTASSQLLSIILKQEVTKSRLEIEKLQRENELLKAKTEALRSAKNVEEMYQKAIDAFSVYHGDRSRDELEDDGDEYDGRY